MDNLNQGLDRLLYALSTYALPFFIGLMSLLALFAWKTQYPAADPQQLQIRVIKESAAVAGPAQALAQLRESSISQFHDTRLSEVPVWLTFVVPEDVEHTPMMVEFPSRHAMDIACWDARTLKALGTGNHQGTTGGITAIKAGFALELSPALKDEQVVCRTSAIGPARLSALIWRANNLQTSAQEFHRKSGLLDGGIIVLAIFVLVTALINRNRLYVLFAAWLVINLRMGALSAGWDTQWLGYTVPYDWLLQGRMITITLYYVLTLILFTSLFRDDLLHVGHEWLVRVFQWTCFPLLILSSFLPSSSYLPLFWPVVGAGISMLAYLLVRILRKTRSRVAMWYGAAISITLVASFYEVLSAALGIKGLIGSVNSVTAALVSSLLAALAIAEQMRHEHVQRLEVQAKLEHTYAAMPIGLFTLDLRGRFTSANPALVGMLGPNVLTDGANAWQQYFTNGAWTQLHQMVHNKSEDEMEIQGKPVPGYSGSKCFLVKATLAGDKIEGSLQDVTEKSRATADLYFLADHDSLTKVLNRRGIAKAFNSAIASLTDRNAPVALAYLDLDRFKLINDLFGHGVGDEVLQQVCGRVSDLLSRELQFGRVGGDEFVIVFPDTPIARAAVMCRGIIDSIDTLPYHVGENAFHVRGSIGLIEVRAGMQFNDAMSTADRACRQAKSGSSGGLVVYEKNAIAFKKHEAELKLIALLATSSATDGLYLEMQPIMSLTKPYESLNFEVLLRMRDIDGNVVPTDRLIAAAENSGRMGMIDRWVLSTTLAWLNTNYTQLKHTKFVCMNLSGASLNDEKFLQEVYVMLEQNLHLVGQLCLEITESVALHDLENTRRFVNKVRGYGAKVALDDFGAGYTSFSYLKEFTADLLKIDGSFIVNMNKHPANIAIVEAIVNLAKNLGMKVIAEWAEDNATVQTLTEIGVDYVQGFAVARAQHPDRLLKAESSASFIQDEALAQYVCLIQKSNQMLPQVDMFSDVRVINMH
ncbi:diguanylate cyclase/phosphodiesterase [Rhodoferax ferrireducens T118]|uniref:Diguanylate cyclase/phosphodiesterase n=1 Tax=Albidiferax ferrireducens (strain ATCC BAA-621 / DSM 15236 / T118) TaxID=338969 RepID=Q21VK1_ALBFT|nr:EAL domain-containing protein [Rhodoferax ferrireducens]ABD70202.1 diguanylate cyclase/phosphodiesterase [Rhodoferax ferrireducens T118]